MPINKIVYGTSTLIDLTSDTITVGDALAGVTFHLRDGSIGTGTLTNGNNLGYGFTDGSIPKVGIAKAGLAHAWGDLLPMMIFGEGEIGVGRVV